MKRNLFTSLLFLIILTGCSYAGDVVTPEGNNDKEIRTYVRPPQLDRWNWGNWIFQVNASHTSIEAVPIRELNLHYNVLKFVEGFPCPNCLQIGSIQHQDDGTFKVEVKLRHPFPGLPRYTGFDVRGTVIFPATHYWWDTKYKIYPPMSGSAYYTKLPLFFSRASDGGAEVMNPDGYSFYLFPGFPPAPDIPICNYQDGKYATGSPEELDGTVNPYIEFHDVDERRMFTCYGEVTRTYHIQPPDGAFKFGYIVDASWVYPDVIPVTDPANDFPFWANCEDGYSLGVTQINPIVPYEYGYLPVEWTLHHRENAFVMGIDVLAPDLQASPGTPVIRMYQETTGPPLLGEVDIVDPWTTVCRAVMMPGAPEMEPGYYPAICISGVCTDWWNDAPAYFAKSPTFEFIDLLVVAE